MLPPPAPPDREELRRRWANGARTMRELDPELWAWHCSRRRLGRIVGVTVVIGVGLVFAFWIWLVTQLMQGGA